MLMKSLCVILPSCCIVIQVSHEKILFIEPEVSKEKTPEPKPQRGRIFSKHKQIIFSYFFLNM